MPTFRGKVRVGVLIVVVVGICLAALYGLLKPISNGCVMTYMYPTYIPITSSESVTPVKYGLYLYHEGWKKIDYREHLKKLSGVPVLFIPGNGGSYKQVRSLAAESDRAYQNGPLEHSFYREASQIPEEGDADISFSNFQLPNQYTSRLDWFAVDLEGEHSAMDGAILEEHTEYVVYAIHKILDQYKVSYDARIKEGAANAGSLPKSVILVGHSMGGFVARAAVIHPHLRKSVVQTVLTLSTPHQSPPVALQPSLGHYFARVNSEWREGYEVQTTNTGKFVSNPVLSDVVVVSISGAYNDYQVRSKLASLDNIVPPTHGFMISSTAMKNVWLSMEHQAIMWCNQLVVQVSHTILSLIDARTGQPLSDSRKRLEVLARMLHSGISHNFNRMMLLPSSKQSINNPVQNTKDGSGSQMPRSVTCPHNIHWNDGGLDRDLYIQINEVTVLAMDGRRRWLDIQKLGSNGKSHFVLVTNLEPCSGIRLHLWPEKGKSTSSLPLNDKVVEITSKMMHIPSGPAPRQPEPGSQTEQPPPSAVFWLGPEDMHGFRFLTISVAPRPTVSGRPPPAASMAVGQFFNPEEGNKDISPWFMLQSTYSQKELQLEESHPLAVKLSFSISLGLLPVTLFMNTVSCGIRNSGLPEEEAGDLESSRLCKLRCFPPVALAWDDISGLHIYPNLNSETIFVDSSPAQWSSTQQSDKTIVLLLVDPHCSYKSSISISVSAAASRLLLLYNSKIVGFSIAVVFFALMQQAYSWDLNLRIPSMLTAVETNLTLMSHFFPLAILPIFFALFLSFFMSQPLPSFVSFTSISLICYIVANGLIAIIILISHLVFFVAAVTHIFIKARWQMWEQNVRFIFLRRFFNRLSSFFSLKVIRVLRANPVLVTALTAVTLACLVHPSFGLLILLAAHFFCCHNALCSSFLTASCRSHEQNNETIDSNSDDYKVSERQKYNFDGSFNRTFPSEDNSNSPDSSKSFGEAQLDLFHHRHGLLVLHLLATLMFAPSVVAWLQRLAMGESLPWLLDSVLCIGVILHGICNSKPEFNSFFLSIPGVPFSNVRLYVVYLIAGYWSYFSGLALSPDRAFYAMAAVGCISFALRMIHRRSGETKEVTYGIRKHSHRH
ncbi:GPI inositol-deacylase-like isoform X1 [Vicia villosa]|uniref:GPI inositol-deacylase-like isoform X1 n=2 Tax=Vicia villosa TaxID=3911 RepID=UPI00273AAFAC|nr:GPI inositol-deacylase-like isoform X1 [Vicia villosa]XP_058761832.1 GPI inositol-deacylase-like isoform X1 [Vicia villosa]